ncbi:SAM-dependent methyltransferase [Salipaludibacillus agaradhaerens]|uniref:SAM-dependent methyltransferase n=1 Tax=Salipaludibacillus agaradhaerens TaxID=76935 RepID=UPI000997C21D|nr:SAM-dependent methyltransferase [Salipaludibacillus agaradhaerens]
MNKYQGTYIGYVSSSRKEMSDDHWGKVISKIVLNSNLPEESLKGLEAFSHLEIIFHMDQVEPEKIVTGARHPRGNEEWPAVGVFAQRAKARPNALGVSRCRLLDIKGRELTVQALDAIDGTPVLDIKPYMNEFAPIGEVKQPAWSSELMRDYYNDVEE